MKLVSRGKGCNPHYYVWPLCSLVKLVWSQQGAAIPI